jgi:hypothetical protein
VFNRARFRPRFRGGLAAAPSLAFDFRNDALDPRISFTRASNGWEFNSAGNLTQYGTNAPRFGYEQSTLAARGLLMEMARTNLALWSRDLTQTAWVKTNITAALDVTGIDGVADTASRLTATAGNGTALQTITAASTNYVTSFFVRRITGTGTVEITQNNGTTWTAITLTSAWQRFVIPAATILNPVIGFRIGTNGDVIAVDVAQTEAEAFPSSPIITTSASVTRAADSGTMASVTPWFNSAEGTLFAEVLFPFVPAFNGTVQVSDLFRLDNGTINHQYNLRLVRESAGVVYVDGYVQTSGVPSFDGPPYSFTENQVCRIALAYNASGFATVFNGGTVTTGGAAALPSGINRVLMNATGSTHYLRRASYYPARLSNATLQAITA